MSSTVETRPAPRPPASDERYARRSLMSRLLTRPEVGALLGAIVIYIVCIKCIIACFFSVLSQSIC